MAERLRGHHDRRDQEQDKFNCRDEARDERRGSPRADQCVGCRKRRVHRADQVRYAASASFVHAHVRARPSASETCGRQPSSRSMRETSRTERWTSPSRASSRRGCASLPATCAHARWSSATVVATPLPTLYGPPWRPTAASAASTTSSTKTKSRLWPPSP